MRPVAAVILLLVGLWSAGTLFMWQVAIQNFAVAERIAGSSPDGLRAAVGALSEEGLRSALRFQASEVNRLFFHWWGWLQIPLAVGCAALAFRLRQKTLVWAALAMLAISLFLAAYVVPETVRFGRLIDFAAEGSMPETHASFWTLHHLYTGLDLLKFGLGLAMAALSVRLVAHRQRS